MKKLMILGLIYCFIGFSTNLAAKERAMLRIQKKDGHKIEGELIGIEDRTLMLIDGSRTYVSCAIDETNMIMITKKSKFLTGAVPGFILGAIGGKIIGGAAETDTKGGFMSPNARAQAEGAVLGAILGTMFGGIISSSIGGPQETFLIEGKSQEETKLVLEKLRSKARFPNYQ
jgi:outer membrane lipoprotein SlyB